MLKGNISIVDKIKCSTVKIGFLLTFLSCKILAQQTELPTHTYINSFSNEAINQMVEYKIPASVTLAQAIFESRCGNSSLAKRSNNHFGIKCHTEWGGDTIRKSDDSLNECFRSYSKVIDSYTDHSLFLNSRARYKNLFKLQVTDYKAWCYGLKNSGYATYAFYPEVLIKIIEENNLYEFDRTEKLPSGSLICSKKQDIIESKFTSNLFSLKEFNANDVLWNDERHILIQSLELIIDNSLAENDNIVDN